MKTKYLQIRLSKQEHLQAKRIASERNMSVSELVRTLLWIEFDKINNCRHEELEDLDEYHVQCKNCLKIFFRCNNCGKVILGKEYYEDSKKTCPPGTLCAECAQNSDSVVK